MTQAPSIFESFNARFLRPTLVAKTFVPSKQFYDLSMLTHTLVIGPRGSGKTTLLRMLQPDALDAWVHPEASRFRSEVGFTGVWIPAVSLWLSQMENMVVADFERGHADRFLAGMLNAHVLSCLADVLWYITSPASVHGSRHVDMSKEAENRFALEVSEIWGISPPSSSLMSLQNSLSAVKARLPELVAEEAERDDPATRRRRLSEIRILNLELVEAVASGLEVFERYTNTRGARWALMFDELEIVPRPVAQLILNALRSRNERLFFKLALAPYDPNFNLAKEILETLRGRPALRHPYHPELDPARDARRAQRGHDYKTVFLSYDRQAQCRRFSRALVRQMLYDRGLSGDVDRLLGQSTLVGPHRGRSGTMEEDWYQELFTDMARRDESFGDFLRRERIDPHSLSAMPEVRRAALVRKHAQILLVRRAYLRLGHGKKPLRQRVTSPKAISQIYGGADSLFAILEGNPRWLIGVFGPLLDEYMQSRRRTGIERHRQLMAIDDAIDEFFALLATIPSGTTSGHTGGAGIDTIIRAIAKYIHSGVIGTSYNPEPSGTFVVDDLVPKSIRDSLALALNAGAIVHVRKSGADTILGDDLVGKRFRLSYLLAPRFGIPLALMKSIHLSTILKHSGFKLDEEHRQ
jgi:hypothetical protein